MLDHVIIAVRDLDAAAARYEAILGRLVAVRSEHAAGTRNALFLFARGPYLELLAPVDAPAPDGFGDSLRRRLDEQGEGLVGLAGPSLDYVGPTLTAPGNPPHITTIVRSKWPQGSPMARRHVKSIANPS